MAAGFSFSFDGTSLNVFNGQVIDSRSYNSPSFALRGNKIKIYESGIYKDAFQLQDITDIGGGGAPINISDAYSQLLALIDV